MDMAKVSEQSVFTSIESCDNGMNHKKSNIDRSKKKLRSLQEEIGDLAIETIARDAIASLGEHNHELARTIIKSDDEADRFRPVCLEKSSNSNTERTNSSTNRVTKSF
jgi:phosphate uptake regulator